MASVIEIGTLIDRDPKIRGGRSRIGGTGLTVSRIAVWYKMGMTPEEIALEYPHLTLAQVHGAGGGKGKPRMSQIRLYLDEDSATIPSTNYAGLSSPSGSS